MAPPGPKAKGVPWPAGFLIEVPRGRSLGLLRVGAALRRIGAWNQRGACHLIRVRSHGLPRRVLIANQATERDDSAAGMSESVARDGAHERAEALLRLIVLVFPATFTSETCANWRLGNADVIGPHPLYASSAGVIRFCRAPCVVLPGRSSQRWVSAVLALTPPRVLIDLLLLLLLPNFLLKRLRHVLTKPPKLTSAACAAACPAPDGQCVRATRVAADESSNAVGKPRNASRGEASSDPRTTDCTARSV